MIFDFESFIKKYKKKNQDFCQEYYKIVGRIPSNIHGQYWYKKYLINICPFPFIINKTHPGDFDWKLLLRLIAFVRIYDYELRFIGNNSFPSLFLSSKDVNKKAMNNSSALNNIAEQGPESINNLFERYLSKIFSYTLESKKQPSPISIKKTGVNILLASYKQERAMIRYQIRRKELLYKQNKNYRIIDIDLNGDLYLEFATTKEKQECEWPVEYYKHLEADEL